MITWHSGKNGLAIYDGSKILGVIPPSQFPALIYDLADVLSKAPKLDGGKYKPKGLG